MSSLVDEEAEEASQGHESEEEEEEEEGFQYSSYGESTGSPLTEFPLKHSLSK